MPDLSHVTSVLPDLADWAVYLAIAVVTLIGVFKCLCPLWATSRALRNGTVGSAVAFLAVYFLCARFFGIQSLYIAYFAHLIWRSAYQTLFARREVYARVP